MWISRQILKIVLQYLKVNGFIIKISRQNLSATFKHNLKFERLFGAKFEIRSYDFQSPKQIIKLNR